MNRKKMEKETQNILLWHGGTKYQNSKYWINKITDELEDVKNTIPLNDVHPMREKNQNIKEWGE